MGTEFFDKAVAVFHRLRKVVPGIDVHQRKWQLGRPKCLFGQVRHNDGVLAAGKEQDGFLKLRGGLAQDVDRFGLELIEVGDGVVCGHGEKR